MTKTPAEVRAHAMLTRALRNFKKFEHDTYGERDAIERDIPLAIEALIDAKIEAAKPKPYDSSRNFNPDDTTVEH